jgi:hypothetical protein
LSIADCRLAITGVRNSKLETRMPIAARKFQKGDRHRKAKGAAPFRVSNFEFLSSIGNATPSGSRDVHRDSSQGTKNLGNSVNSGFTRRGWKGRSLRSYPEGPGAAGLKPAFPGPKPRFSRCLRSLGGSALNLTTSGGWLVSRLVKVGAKNFFSRNKQPDLVENKWSRWTSPRNKLPFCGKIQ